MLRALLLIGLAASFVTGALAQEQPAGAAAGPIITEALPRGHVEYEIELKILEGKGLIPDDSREPEGLLGVPERGDLAPEIADRKPTPLALPTPALAHPPDRPTTDADRASKVQANSAAAPPPAPDEVSDAEFMRRMYFDLLLREPTVSETRAFLKDEDPHKRDKLYKIVKISIGRELRGATVLATPKVMVAANRPATVRIGTEQIFSYLEPLGNGKFQVKRSPVHELGLTFTLEIQPVAGDERSVDLSRFEIQVSGLDGREPVEGIEDLDVGRPIVSKRSLQTTAKIRLGDTRMIAIPSGPKTQAVVLLRVKRVDTKK